MGILDALITGGLALGGALIASNANKSAAKEASGASIEAAQIGADAARYGYDVYAEQAEKARQEYREAAARGVDALRTGTDSYIGATSRFIRDPDRLTRGQEIGLNDLRREMTAGLASSGLRGAGRAGAGVYFDTVGRYTADAYNRNESDLKGVLEGIGRAKLEEGGAIANTEIGAGNMIGQSLSGQGAAGANAALQAGQASAAGVQAAGQIGANATTANAGIWGDALGTLGAIVADQAKQASSPTLGKKV